mgnify:CR=1 FL=1
MDTTISIGRTIARERRRRGVTQEELAAHLSVSKAAVSSGARAELAGCEPTASHRCVLLTYLR